MPSNHKQRPVKTTAGTARTVPSDGELALWKKLLFADDPVAHNQLGLISEQEGDEAAAAGHYEHAIGSYGAFAEARYNLGRLLFKPGRYTEAQPHFERALASRPDYTAALYRKAIAHT